MTTEVAHASLTGTELHEPKGIDSADSNTVYVANGTGSGAWTSGSVLLTLTGMISDFALPIAPTGWLECDGAAVSRSTYADLFEAITIQQTASRTATSTTVTVVNASHMKAGYFVEGVGITAGTTIASIAGVSSIVLSAAATSTGTSTLKVSPYAFGDGSTTFRIPNALKRYRRGRDISAPLQIGTAQADTVGPDSHIHTATTTGTATSNGAHTHTTTSGTLTSTNQSADHTHTSGTVTTSVEDGVHSHTATVTEPNSGTGHVHGAGGLFDAYGSDIGVVAHGGAFNAVTSVTNAGGQTTSAAVSGVTVANGLQSANHHHDFSFTSAIQSANHTHNYSFTLATDSQGAHTHPLSATTTVDSQSTGLTETRPLTLVVLTCIKT